MDVKTTFLNGDLEEKIYMEQPEEKILKKYNYFDSKPACTPYDSSVKLFKNTGDSVNQSEYASIIGSLRYATDCTRLDIAYVVGLLCYNDVDWNFLSDDSKATSGYIFNISGGAVAWKSKKQTILVQSTMKSKMIALVAKSKEASWFRSLLSKIPTWERSIPAILIHYDSIAAITKVQNHYYNGNPTCKTGDPKKQVQWVITDHKVPSYRTTLDRFTFVNVEVRAAFYGILGRFLEHSLKWDIRARP
ncbi:putative Polyprotein [Cucumis melo var. makuwa]|uniref:Polyprotein n=1 Tax=Cucumis melo var. makuwa TaxID=1194695 RepID=A0A5A7T1D5_CUCMM|nr:putative Polyprotein [Cucumis melo var. makuwa]TYK03348.1 putative Polyprotein [Cucumis melo var. makuwa]